MEAIKIEILNPKVLRLIEGMQDLNLIRISEKQDSKLKSYLKKMRVNAASAPGLDEITDVVKEARAERYEKK